MMKSTSYGLIGWITPCLSLVITVFVFSTALAQETERGGILLHAARVFDGNNMRTNTSVLLVDGQVAQIGARGSFESDNARVIDLGDATIETKQFGPWPQYYDSVFLLGERDYS